MAPWMVGSSAGTRMVSARTGGAADITPGSRAAVREKTKIPIRQEVLIDWSLLPGERHCPRKTGAAQISSNFRSTKSRWRIWVERMPMNAALSRNPAARPAEHFFTRRSTAAGSKSPARLTAAGERSSMR